MEDRELSGVERELRSYLSAQLDRLPVRSAPGFSPPRRRRFGAVAALPATMLLALIAVGAGLALADWRAYRTASEEPQVTSGGVPGPLALAGGAPSLRFGLVSTLANTLLVRNEITETAPLTINSALPQVAVSPNGHEIAYWRILPDRTTGQPLYELLRSDVIDPAIRDRLVMRAPGDEVPGSMIWSSDGTGLVANTHTAPTRGSDAGSPATHVSWFAIEVVSGTATELAPGFESAVSTVYAWDRQRDLITGSGLNAGQNTFSALQAGRVTTNAVTPGALIAAADAYGRTVVVAYAGDCKGVAAARPRCPVLEMRDQASFSTIAAFPVGEATKDFPDVVFRSRSQDLIVQLPLQNAASRVELWSDLGRGPHQVLASYAQSGSFTARRELMLPRVDGSAVFLLKFDDSAGGRWFGEIVSLGPTTSRSGPGPERTPFEILIGGNPLASVVLAPALARAMDPHLSAAPKPSPSSSPARDAILQRFSRTTAEIRRVDRIDAKLVTRAEFERAANTGSSSPNVDPTQLIWVVAFSGDIVPQFSRGQAFTWGIYLVSADSGDILGMLAGAGPWPPYFDGLPSRMPSSTSTTIDCGTVRATNGFPPYDQAVLDCLWASYTRGDAARLSLTMVTQEGDPVPTTILAVPGGRIEMTRDLTADNFSNSADRAVKRYSCTTISRRQSVTDPARYTFDLSGCTGPSATATFP